MNQFFPVLSGRMRAIVFILLVAGAALLDPRGAYAAARGHAPSVVVPQGWPRTIAIPRINVRAAVESNSLSLPTDAHAPFKWEDAAWYNRGPRPGEVGNAIMFGHLDSTCCPAIFWSLSALRAGDLIQVGYGTRTLTFRVMWLHTYANTALPMRWMYGNSRQRGLVIYTCAGVFHHDGTGYDHKLMVFARLLLPGGRLG